MRYVSFLMIFLVWGSVCTVLTVDLCSQPSNHLLSIDPVALVLPEEIRIQATARRGSTELAVWGSTVATSDVEFRNVLYVQVVEGNQAVGEPKILHSPEAIPFGFVHVIPVDMGFRVFWNDRRNGTVEIFAQDFDESGSASAAGEEVVVGEGTVRRIEAIGDPTNQFVFLHRSALPPLFVTDRGLLRELGHLPDLQDRAAVVSPDSSLALISEQRFLYFNSFLDTLPQKEFAIEMEDSALVATTTLTRRQNGDYLLTFVTKGEPSQHTSFDAALMLRVVRKTFSLTDNVLRDRQELDSFLFGAGVVGISTVYVAGAEKRRVCNQHFHVQCSCRSIVRIFGQPDKNDTVLWVFATDSSDHISTLYSSEYGVGTCGIPVTVDIHRVESDSTSVVEVESSSGTLLQLVAPAALLEERRRHLRPALALRDDALLVTWNRPDDGYSTVAHQWDVSDGSSGSLRLVAERTGAAYFRTGVGGVITFTSRARFWQQNHGWIRTWDMQYSLPTTNGWLSILKESGGHVEISGTNNERSPERMAFDPDSKLLLIASRSPIGEHYLYAVNLQGEVQWSQEKWKLWNSGQHLLAFPDRRFAVISFADTVSPNIARIYREGEAVDSATLEDLSPQTSFERLLNGRTLRYEPSQNSRDLRLMLYDEDFQLLEQFSFGLDDSLTGAAVAQSPVDSSLAIVATTLRGATLTTLAHNLVPLYTDQGELSVNLPVSSIAARAAAPFALFRSDTLVMVWEDYRKEYPDIYGAWLRPVDYVSSVSENSQNAVRGEQQGQLSITPNPATDQMRVDYVLERKGDVTVSMISALGKTVWHQSLGKQEVGLHSLEITPWNLPEGMYILLLHVSGNAYVSKNLIIHRD